MKFCIIFMTASSLKEGKAIAQTLLKEKLAACINRIGNSESSYWWKGKIESAKETLLIIKTEKKKVKALIKKVKKIHSYTVPEIIACPIIEGNSDYLNWMTKSLGGPI